MGVLYTWSTAHKYVDFAVHVLPRDARGQQRVHCEWCGWEGRAWMSIPDALGRCADVSYMVICYWLAAGAAYCAIRMLSESVHRPGHVSVVVYALDLTVYLPVL